MRKYLLTIFIIIFISVILVLIAGVYKFNFTNGGDILPEVTISDVKNISCVINGEVFNLKNGLAIKDVSPNSVTKNTLRFFGEPVYGDLNDDGEEDAAVLLSNDQGGSGIFYYAVLAIKNGDTYKSTNTLFLGDRIAPQTVNIINGRAVYNYAERKFDEPMTARPSIGKSLWVHYDKKNGEIGEWVKDFEGEVDMNKFR